MSAASDLIEGLEKETGQREVYELMNPERCMKCGKFAKWQIVEEGVSYFFCDEDMPEPTPKIA